MGDSARRQSRFGGLVLLLLLTVPAPGRAQDVAPAAGRRPASPAGAWGRSLVLPGWGQHHMGQRRWVAYALLEAGLWALWADRRGDGARYRTAYRDLAWDEGRLQLGSRVDGDWAYYERLSTWTRSGSFDGDSQRAGVQPEGDPSTYNGWIWSLARGLFFPSGQTPPEDDPAYRRALEYYGERAYGPEFLWDWTGREPSLDEMNRLIDRSDDRFRQATAAVGAVLANHLLSSVDAFLSARATRSAALRVSPDPWSPGVRWTVVLRIAGVR